MISAPAALIVAGLLLLFLLPLAFRGLFTPQESSSGVNVALPTDIPDPALCPPQFVARIFSQEDWDFVSATKSPHLQRFFERERRDVALAWVRQTCTAIRHCMREHAAAARQSKDLEFKTEIGLVILYVRLMFVCGILFAVIYSTGPLWLRGLGVYADSLSQRVASAQRGFESARLSGEIHGAGRV